MHGRIHPNNKHSHASPCADGFFIRSLYWLGKRTAWHLSRRPETCRTYRAGRAFFSTLGDILLSLTSAGGDIDWAWILRRRLTRQRGDEPNDQQRAGHLLCIMARREKKYCRCWRRPPRPDEPIEGHARVDDDRRLGRRRPRGGAAAGLAHACASAGGDGAVVLLAPGVSAYPFNGAELERVRRQPPIRPMPPGLIAVRILPGQTP